MGVVLIKYDYMKYRLYSKQEFKHGDGRGLENVLKETLENRGVLGQIKARIRAEVLRALDDQDEEKPSLSNENMLINELIREYLEFNRYKYTLSVLLTETGQPKECLSHEFLANELNIAEDKTTKPVPLLYSILAHSLKEKHIKDLKPQTTVTNGDVIANLENGPVYDEDQVTHIRKPEAINITNDRKR
ncbi:centrosomal protein 20-like [Xenia sp. Carnegie-2017]|uniref:centrosomal protein 20-like n=1 Tax=Xenia sp. Carnegie-2017 TaxID=2897299 RepID=UPI001F03BEFD|nr:centrosomal protein 20-like [Xenia sp. Carnegie-2017]